MSTEKRINSELAAENESLMAERDALAVENAAMRAAIDDIAATLETGTDGMLFTAVDNAVNLEVTQTDAALAAIEARGVEKFAESQKDYVRQHRDELDPMTRAAYCGSAVDAERYAKQLREAK
ncbi:TPA: hypothetical protein ACKP36_000936 [Serratia marcescens]